MAKSKKTLSILDRESVVAFGEHITGDGRALFSTAATGGIYLSAIERELAQLKEAVRAAEASDEVAEATTVAEDLRTHTALANTLWFGLSAVVADPAFDTSVKGAAAKVLAGLGEQPKEKTRAATRFAQASAIRTRMADLQPELALLPAPIGGGTFAERIERMCVVGARFKGELIEGVVREAAASPPPVTGRNIAAAVQRLNGLLGRARATLRDEVAYKESLPRTLEAEVFGLFDELLEARRAQPKKSRKTKHKPEADAPATEKPATP
jgi:hypothetical protein